MKQSINLPRISRIISLICLVFLASFTEAQAQAPTGTVIPTVCFESKPETLTLTISRAMDANFTFEVAAPIPLGFYSVVLNPGGATEERFPISYARVGGSGRQILINYTGNHSQIPVHPHPAGETVLLTSSGDALFGYNNTGNTAVTISRSVSAGNYFFPGPASYLQQPSVFQPGIHENLFSLKVVSGYPLTWFLDGGEAISTANAEQGCATITYQGRLSDAGNTANGQYDLQFQAFNTETGGTAQSELIAMENVQVTNGIFTVQLKFGSTLTNNLKPRFLEIGVRPGASTGAFTLLTPRQPITDVPFAVNAQTAKSIVGGTIQLPLTTNAPSSADCRDATRGQMRVDAINNKLYICTATGWKSTTLQ